MVLFRYLFLYFIFSGLTWGETNRLLEIPQLPVAPEGERLVFKASYEQIPGLGLELLLNHGGLHTFSSAESVGDGASLLISQRAKGGVLFSATANLETFEQDGSFSNYTGFSFWVKGDGSAAVGAVAFTTTNAKKGHSTFRFPLSNTNWHKVFAPWEEFFPRIKYVQKPSTFVLGLVSPGLGSRSYLMDRFHLYTDEVIEEIVPTLGVEVEHDLAVGPWIRKAESFDTAYHKLENREQFTLLFLMEEAVVGRALIGSVIPRHSIKDENFSGTLGNRIRKRFQYHEGGTFLEQYSLLLEQWVPISSSSLRRGRFETITLVFRGVQTASITQHFKKIESYDPDLVIVQHGLYDMLYGSLDQYRVSLEKVVQGLLDDGAVGVICSPFPVPDFRPREHLGGRSPWAVGADVAQVCDEVALKYGLSYVDCYGAFNARGPRALGEVFFYEHDLKLKGHKMAAELLYGLIDQRRVRIWRYAPTL